jgi:hypothetical protein
MIASFSFYPVSLSVGTPDPIIEEKKETQQFTRGQDRLASRLSTDLTLLPPIKAITSQGFPSGHQESCDHNKPARSSLSPKSASFRSCGP